MSEEEKKEFEVEIPVDVTVRDMELLISNLKRTVGIKKETIDAAEALLEMLKGNQ